ncbi:MAG: YaaA family protein [Sulfuricurvum sp.]|nr:YaaA family protein [Sulfuricurvum sp.]
MVILFAPSEGKRPGGEAPSLSSMSLIFPHLYDKRLEVISKYQNVIRDGEYSDLKELFGLKDEKEFERFKIPYDRALTMKAIERYDGVAYDYLGYGRLSCEEQSYIDEKVILFSNLFGPISAGDFIPDYKLKQGASINTMAPEKFYKKHFTGPLDELIGDQEVLDLRAGFYDKFYTCDRPPMTLKFLKEGKVVSHWAKAYRGIVLRTMAQNQIRSLSDFRAMKIDGLTITDVVETQKKQEIIYTIG